MKFLSAPWRWNFISRSGEAQGCVFCEIPNSDDKNSLVCFRGKNFFVILNKYPYNTGHLMVVPYKHIGSPSEINSKDSVEMWSLMNKSIDILEKNFKPHGFNIGMNIGGAAGAGIKDHIHLHVVPRWSGDSNFMGVIGDTKILSYKIEDIFDIIKKSFNK